MELGRPPHGRHCVDLSHFSLDDVKQCLATLPRETACGVDGVKYEMLRLSGARLNEILVQFVNKMIDTKCQGLPDWFFEAILTPVPKIKASGAGDEALDPKNYRPIMLQSVLYKLFALLMLPRVERWAAKLMVPDASQCGFRRGQGAVHAVTAAMIKLKKDRERRGLSTSAVFLDTASAYDTVDRSLLIHLFQWLRAGDDFCDLLRHLQCRVAAVVLLGEAWSGKPGFESHRQPLCLFGGVGRKRLAPSSCTGGVHKGSVRDRFRAFPTGGCWTVV